MALFFGPGGWSFGDDQRVPPASLAIENVAIVDVVTGSVSEPRTVVVTAGRIAAIAVPSAAEVSAVAKRVDGTGRYLMPGLVDMHVHLFNNATHRPPNEWTFPLFIANGVTAVREMAAAITDFPTIMHWRHGVEAATLTAPRVIAAGVPIGAGSTEEMKRKVHEAKSAGADFIKVFSHLPEPQWRALLEQARREGLSVCGHVPNTVEAVAAARAGQRSNEHLTQLYEACSTRGGELLARRLRVDARTAEELHDAEEREVLETFDAGLCAETSASLQRASQVQVPTLILAKVQSRTGEIPLHDDPRWSLLRADEQARWEKIMGNEAKRTGAPTLKRWEISRTIVNTLHRAGVPILAGTDSPMPLVYPGFSLHEELELLVESGLSPAAALRAATLGAAEFLGLASETGSIAVGKQADFVLLEGNPLGAIGNTRRIQAVVLAGRVLDRNELDALLAAKPR